jgi:hypothetical protein
MTRLYLAGPMTGYPRWNYDAFTEAAAQLREVGFDVVSPHELDLAVGFDPDAPAEDFTQGMLYAAMRRDIQALLTVEGVALLPGWEASDGVQIETSVALSLGLPVSTVDLFLAIGPHLSDLKEYL